jgi:hypothetical protein
MHHVPRPKVGAQHGTAEGYSCHASVRNLSLDSARGIEETLCNFQKSLRRYLVAVSLLQLLQYFAMSRLGTGG